jgi:hypothetical protein
MTSRPPSVSRILLSTASLRLLSDESVMPVASICQHMSAYASIRQHTSAYVREAVERAERHACLDSEEGNGGEAYRSSGDVRQHTSAYISIRQHTSVPAWTVRKVIGARPIVAAATCGTTGRRMRGAARLMKKLGVIGKMRITSRRRFLRQYLSSCTSKASVCVWCSIALLRQKLSSCTSKVRACGAGRGEVDEEVERHRKDANH